MTETLAPGTLTPYHDSPKLSVIVEHWAKARIDGPTGLIARFDDAGRQLVGVGGLLQVAYLGLLSFGGLRTQVQGVYPLIPFVTLLSTVFCAARVVCLVPIQMEAFQTYKLIRQDQNGVPIAELDEAFQRWCSRVDALAEKKRRWLHAANVSLILTMVATLVVAAIYLLHASR